MGVVLRFEPARTEALHECAPVDARVVAVHTILKHLNSSWRVDRAKLGTCSVPLLVTLRDEEINKVCDRHGIDEVICGKCPGKSSLSCYLMVQVVVGQPTALLPEYGHNDGTEQIDDDVVGH